MAYATRKTFQEHQKKLFYIQNIIQESLKDNVLTFFDRGGKKLVESGMCDIICFIYLKW